jgi:hypothetical protein
VSRNEENLEKKNSLCVKFEQSSLHALEPFSHKKELEELVHFFSFSLPPSFFQEKQKGVSKKNG